MVQTKFSLNTLEPLDECQGNQRQAVSEIELARIAGFFAGEGCIVLSGHVFPTLYVSLGNTEQMWINLFHTNFGGSVYVDTPKYLGAKYMFRWRASGKSAERFLQAIRPFLIGEKVQQLELGLKFQALKNTWPKNKHFPIELTCALESMRNDMRNLRRAAAETNRENASPVRSDSPTPLEMMD